MIDIFIVVFSFIGSVAYVLIHCIFVRYVDACNQLMFSFRLQMFIGFLLVLSLITMVTLNVMISQTAIIVAVASQVIFHGIVMLYLFMVFRVFDQSLTIRLLAFIANGGRDGRSKAEISRAFRPRRIVKQYLDRCSSILLLRHEEQVYRTQCGTRACGIFLLIDRCMKIFFSPVEQQRNV